MARRRRYGYGRSSAAPKAIKVKAPKLDVGGLATAYEWMTAERALGFRLAFEWYSNNLTALLFGDPLDAERQKQYDKAAKAKQLGDHNTSDGEKFQAWTTALRLYEKIWTKRNLPKSDSGLNTATPNRRVAQIQSVLSSLNTAFETFGIRYRIALKAEREFNGTEILVPQAELIAMISQAPIKVALAEAITVAKVLSIVMSPEGPEQLDGAAFMANLPRILEGICEWAAKSPKNGFQALGKVATIRAPKVPGTVVPRTTAVASKIIHVVNMGLASAKGKRQVALNTVYEGMTVADLKRTLTSIQMADYTGWVIKTALDKGAITLE